jgi:hypothetical protein
MGFKPIDEDPYVYLRDDGAMIMMYVDDTIIAAPDDDIIQSTIDDIAKLQNQGFGRTSSFLRVQNI